MDKDFEWLKWVGLSVVISILVAVYFVRNEAAQIEQQAMDQKTYDNKIEMAAQAIHESEIAEQQAKLNPTVYPAISLKQTQEFFYRIEQAMTENSNIDLSYTPDIARHSRVFNSFVKEAEAIYGTSDLANPYRWCTGAANSAYDVWSATYDQSSRMTKNKSDWLNKSLIRYGEHKRACLEEVVSKFGV